MQSLVQKPLHLIFTSLWLLVFLTASSDVEANGNKPFTINKIRDYVYVISHIGKNGHINLGVVEGDDGLLLINSWMEWGKEEYAAAIKTISDKPVKYVINSNDDPYNHQGNKFWADKGAVIISHENFKYSPGYHQVLFKDKLSLTFGSELIIAYQSSAHSLGHINIFLEQANVAFMADSFRNDWFSPQGEKGLVGYLEGLDKALSMGNEKTLFVPGNTGNKITSNATGVRKVRAIVSQFTERVGQLYKQGLSVNEIVNDEKLAALAQQFEKYSVYKNSLRGRVISIIETNFIKPFSLSPKELLGYTGVYKFDDNSAIEVVIEEGALLAREEGKFLFELTAHSKEKFDFKKEARTDHLTFQFSADGKVQSLLPVLEENSWWLEYIPPVKRFKVNKISNVF